jgi:diguanylate cyclase
MSDLSPRLKPQELIARIEAAQAINQAFAVVCLKMHRTDRLGALSGDALARDVLIHAVSRIRGALRDHDCFSIVSVDEVWCFLPGIGNESFALLTASALRDSLLEPLVLQSADGPFHSVQFRPSLGVVLISDAQIAANTLIRIADQYSDRAVNSEDRIHLEQVQANKLIRSDQEIEAAVREALFSNELEVYFQPQISLRDRRCLSAEALIRLNAGSGQAIRADVIADVCQRGGMMDALTRYIINNVMRNQLMFKSLGIPMQVSVNLSPLTLSNATFPAMLEQASQTWSVPLTDICLEITEGSLVENEHAAIRFMKRLRSMGCEIALDDFGTGYSSFSYLREFPISELKIDKLFITHLIEKDQDRRIVQGLLDLCKAFDLRSVCEGVENLESIEYLTSMGCDRAQGYYYAPALPAEPFIEWVRAFSGDHSDTLDGSDQSELLTSAPDGVSTASSH